MIKSRFLKAGAIGTLATALLLTALPAQAQDGRGWGNRGGARAERPAARADNDRGNRDWGARRDTAPAAQGGQPLAGNERGGLRAPSARTEAAPTPPVARNSSYTAPRDRSYGMAGRNGGWQGQREAAQPAPQSAPAAAAQARGYAGRSGDWNRDRNGRGDDARRADWQNNRGDQARRAERRDDARNYANGYRDGRRDDNRWDNRYGNNNRRWDNRGWRNDNRYDWYRYRAANRGLYSLGRYYSPYRGYTYSRISIGFTLGSLFYSNRYWINDPWQYRLPPVYGGYRWVRYYDDALLVDTYSGQVVDVIYDFFW